MSHASPLSTGDPACSETSLEALSAAFALIACADAALAPSELDRFREVIRTTEACHGLDFDEIDRRFLALSQQMLDDFDAGSEQALAAIRAVRDDPPARERVLAAAQVAVVADGRLREIEEHMLRQICLALGVDPEDY
jgi:tellurite resistance protein TerB